MSEQQAVIRVALADDHKMVRKGLAILIGGFDDLELVGEASNGAEAVRLCGEAAPDVLLMDLIMPDMDGVAATRAIRESYPEIQVIALTSFKDPSLIQAALKAGAIGYILKDCAVDELVEAIRAAKAGRPSLAWEAAQSLISATVQPSPSSTLTERELEVLSLMAKGLTNRQIAEQLRISPHTVNAHASSILSKLNVASRTEAVALGFQQNLIRH